MFAYVGCHQNLKDLKEMPLLSVIDPCRVPGSECGVQVSGFRVQEFAVRCGRAMPR